MLVPKTQVGFPRCLGSKLRGFQIPANSNFIAKVYLAIKAQLYGAVMFFFIKQFIRGDIWQRGRSIKNQAGGCSVIFSVILPETVILF